MFSSCRGVWNVPFMSGAYLIQDHVLQAIQGAYTSSVGLDPDMAFCATLRAKVGVIKLVYFMVILVCRHNLTRCGIKHCQVHFW